MNSKKMEKQAGLSGINETRRKQKRRQDQKLAATKQHSRRLDRRKAEQKMEKGESGRNGGGRGENQRRVTAGKNKPRIAKAPMAQTRRFDSSRSGCSWLAAGGPDVSGLSNTNTRKRGTSDRNDRKKNGAKAEAEKQKQAGIFFLYFLK